jgi:hypothetical protein
MNCADAQTLLSAYFDGELSEASELELRDHLRQCARCSAELDSFRQLSTLAHGLYTPQTPDSIWRQLEVRLDEDDLPLSSTSKKHSSYMAARLLVLAATLLVAVGLGWFTYETWFGHGERDAFAAEFGHYLEAFHRDPEMAQEMLIAKYDGVAVDSTQAIQLVGYRPATANATHNEFRVKSTHVLKMPCCTCVQTVCERADGSTVVIFEHDDENPEWFGDRRETTAHCSGKRCRLFDIQDQIAASWKMGGRHITAIGVRDAGEVSHLVSWLQGDAQASSS